MGNSHPIQHLVPSLSWRRLERALLALGQITIQTEFKSHLRMHPQHQQPSNPQKCRGKMLLLPAARKKRNDHTMQTCHRMLRVPTDTEGVPHVWNTHHRYSQNFHSLIIHMLHHSCRFWRLTFFRSAQGGTRRLLSSWLTIFRRRWRAFGREGGVSDRNCENVRCSLHF